MPVPDFSPGEVLTAAAMDQVGLWLVKSQTVGSTVGAVDITSCFNSNFRNYRVTFEGGSQSGNNLALQLQFANTTNHFANMRYDSWSGFAAGTLPTTAQNFAYFGLSGANSTCTFSMDVLDPFLAQYTKYTGLFTANDYYGSGGGVYAANTSLTGFTIIFPGYTNTGGIVKVYGYRD
jgi:hypothetical protein